jgi:hypothetical protein
MDSLSCGIPDRFQKAARLPLTIHATSSSSVTFSAKSRSRFRETAVTLRRNHRSRCREIRNVFLAPVKLAGITRCKDQRDKGFRSRAIELMLSPLTK